MKIVFLGTPQIAVSSLEYLVDKVDVDVQAVVSQPDKPAGRGKKLCATPICCVANDREIPVYQPVSIKKDAEVIEALKDLEPDFFVTFAFGQILSQEVIDIPKYGCVNLHASLLPAYRGANPLQAPILNGDKKTGITTMLTELGLDSGDIVKQKEIDITENMTAKDLEEIVAEISPEFIYESLKGIKDGSITPAVQDESLVTMAPKVKKENGLIDWSQPAEKIHNKIRGLFPWPSAFTYIRGNCIKITESRLNHEAKINIGSYGEILGKIGTGVQVMTGDDILLATRVQPACKGEQEAASWYNGARLQKSDKFETLERPPS